MSGQTAKTRADLFAELDTILADVGEEPITPADHRLTMKNAIASAFVPLTDGTPLLTTAIGDTLQAHSAALDTIAANGSAYYLARGNHTGTQLAATISDFSDAALGFVTWTTLTGKPSTFTPSTHTHAIVDTTGLQAALDAKETPAGAQAKADAAEAAAEATAAADATSKANAAQAYAIQRANHTGAQAISTVTGLQTALDGKAATSHTHTASQVSDSTATGRAVLTAADPAAARTAIGAGTSSFSGAYGDLSGLPTLGTAAATAATDYATAAQGALADSATQPGDLATVATTGAYSDLSGAPTIPSAIFSTLAVSGQSDVVADSATDTLTLVAGSNVTLTTNAGTDTITIAASGGGSGDVATDTIWDAKGDLAVGTGANTAQRLAAGTNGHVLTLDSAETAGMKWAAPSGGGGADDPNLTIRFGTHFITDSPFRTSGSTLTSNFAGATGIGWLHTTTSASGHGCYFDGLTAGNLNQVGLGAITIRSRVYVPVLSTSGERFAVRVGLGNALNADFTNGIYFEYDESSSVNWRMCAADNSSYTRTDSGVAVATATWQKLRIEINAAGTSAEFFIDDSSVGTVTTNIPTTAGRSSGPRMHIVKSAGTTQRAVYFDYYEMVLTLTTAY